MDPTDEGRSSGRFETFDANARLLVVRDDDGYGVWRLDDLEDGEPIERFPDGDAGYEAAAARWRQLTRQDRRERTRSTLRWVVPIAAGLWVVSAAVSGVLLFQVQGDPSRSTGLFQTLWRWSQVAMPIAQAVTLGGLAVAVVARLEHRR